MKRKGYIPNNLPDDASDEEIASELRRLADKPSCPTDVREMILNVLHASEIELRDARTKAARKAASKALREIEKSSKAKKLRPTKIAATD